MHSHDRVAFQSCRYSFIGPPSVLPVLVLPTFLQILVEMVFPMQVRRDGSDDRIEIGATG